MFINVFLNYQGEKAIFFEVHIERGDKTCYGVEQLLFPIDHCESEKTINTAQDSVYKENLKNLNKSKF